MKHAIKIAISGKSGCGNSTVSRIVSEKLGLRMINYTFHNMADEKGIEFKELCRLAEQDSSYDLFLDNRLVELARPGHCVLGSRLAIWILKDADLKVYLDASIDVRARRIYTRENGSYEQKREETLERDRNDRERYLKLYGIDNDKYDFADLIIDTEQYDPEGVAGLVIEAALRINS